MPLSKRAHHGRAVLTVLRRRKWMTAVDLTYHANALLPEKVKRMTTATATARLRDFRRPEYGGHTIAREDHRRGFDAPVYRWIR